MIDTPLFCKALKFASHASSEKDVRYCLNGVRFEVIDTTLTLCATDGARVAVCSVRLDPTLPSDAAITVPNDDVKRVLSAFRKDKGQVSIVITKPEAGQKPTLTVSAGGVSLDIDGADGVYPDYRRAIPAAGRAQGGMPVLNAKYMAEACAAIEPLAGSYKGTYPLEFDATGITGDSIVIRPGFIHDPRITALLVVIAPIRK